VDAEGEVGELLMRAFQIEEEGFAFYSECAKETEDADGRRMFSHLAGEEKKHFERFAGVWAENVDSQPPSFNPDHKQVTGFFAVGGASQRDELDALNSGVEAERKSITLYSYIAKRSDLTTKARGVVNEILGEEEKHLAILNAEAESVTKTGEYIDFKTVTS
jgi:rubrerythrin